MGPAAKEQTSCSAASKPPLCFISHAWANGGHDFAVQLCNHLRSHRINTWIDSKEVPVGTSVRHSYREGILRTCDAVLALVTPEWHTSEACQDELHLALKRQRSEALHIFPVHRNSSTTPVASLGDACYVVLENLDDEPTLASLAEAIRRGTIVNRLAVALLRQTARERRESAKLLGQMADPLSEACLGRSLSEDSDPLTRYWSAIALGRIGTPGACGVLRSAEAKEEDDFVLEGINYALEQACKAGDTR